MYRARDGPWTVWPWKEIWRSRNRVKARKGPSRAAERPEQKPGGCKGESALGDQKACALWWSISSHSGGAGVKALDHLWGILRFKMLGQKVMLSFLFVFQIIPAALCWMYIQFLKTFLPQNHSISKIKKVKTPIKKKKKAIMWVGVSVSLRL